MPSKKAKEMTAEVPSAASTERQTILGEAPCPTEVAVRHDGVERVLDVVVTRVISTLDVDGLSKELTTKLAERLLGSVKVDALVGQILDAHTETLTTRLTDRLTAELLGLGQ